jgi:hypothetical protein
MHHKSSMKRTAAAGFIVMLVAVLTTSSQAQFLAHLTLQSQPGDFIGQGGNFDISYSSALGANISPQIRRTLAGSPAELLFVVDDAPSPPANTLGLLFFGTDQLGIPIQPGTYGLPGNTAQRADFAAPGHAGLDVSFQNRGSNTLTGNFTISDVTFYQDAVNTTHIGTFSASFEQHSEGATPALFGTFTFNDSRRPNQSSVPEPSAAVLLGTVVSTCAMFAIRRRRN